MADTLPAGARTGPDARTRRCRRKFLHYFRGGFRDPTYREWERDYKVAVHAHWQRVLGRAQLDRLIQEERYLEAARLATQVEQRSKHPMLFSFEKMALRDAIRTEPGARQFVLGLREFLHGDAPRKERFLVFGRVLDGLPRRQTRVHTWPLHTVFGFIARPRHEMFVKPRTVRRAAEAYGFELEYASRPGWTTYSSVLRFAERIRRDVEDLGPQDMIDLQSFIWVLGSSEYE
ncbi:MAG TPA: hypothetical protein VFI53_01070 [Myxococcaceae bacterium]|nr:hypothetical protein [Myxococcaceae bacterium]